MAQNCIVIAVSDLHTNSTIALAPPKVTLDDGGSYVASVAQIYLWRKWQLFWKRVAEVKAEAGLPVVTVINGDICDGDHHNTGQIITRNDATQIDIALEVLDPLTAVSDRIFVLRGTEAHVGHSAWREELVAKEIGAIQDGENHTFWHLFAEFGGVTFDIQHHGESGSMRPWTAGGEANRIAAIVAYEYADTGTKPPQVALRAHRHGWRDSGTTHATQVFVTPPWQLTTAFGHRIGLGTKIQKVGGAILTCKDGRYTVEKVLFQPARPRPVKVEFGDND
jgi:hypothetical protein